jgi:glutamyl-tRNA synthetase
MPLVKERLHFLTDAPAMMRYLFEDPALPAREEFIPKKLDAAKTSALIASAIAFIPNCDFSNTEAAELALRGEAERLGVKFGDFMMPIRVAVTGSRVSPPLFESIALLGVPVCVRRMEKAGKLFS